MGIVKILIIVGVALALGWGTGYASGEQSTIPTGVVDLRVQPDTRFNLTCNQGATLQVNVDGGSRGWGYCTPVEEVK